MPFSLTSYLLGVATVVGALAFGFGGGVLLTNTAMKETAAGSTKIERVARSNPEPAAASPQAANAQDTNAKVTNVKENPAPPVEPAAPAVRPDPVPAVQAEVSKPEPAKQTENVKQENAKQPEQSEAEQKKAAERKIERQKRYAERKVRDVAAARMKQQQLQLEVQDQSERSESAFGREQRHFDLFRMLTPPPFDRSDGMVPVDRDD
jgi:type IV secretory pathway VirB10-like protein